MLRLSHIMDTKKIKSMANVVNIGFLERLTTTCVACKYAPNCRALGIVKDPFHPKCAKHELVDDFNEKKKTLENKIKDFRKNGKGLQR